MCVYFRGKSLKKESTSQISSKNQSCVIPPLNKKQEQSSLIITDDKENSHNSRLSVDDHKERKLKRKRQTLFSNNCTPLSTQRVSNVGSAAQSGLNDSGKSTEIKLEVVLVNDSLESKDKSTSHVQDDIYVEDSVENYYRCNKPTDLNNGSPSEKFNLNENSLFCSCAPRSNGIKVHGLGNSDCTRNIKENNVALQFDSCHLSYVTSTPVFDIDTSPLIGGTGMSDSENSSLMDGKVVLEPLRITPIQWKKLSVSSSFTEKTNSENCNQLPSDEDRHPEVLKSSGTSTNHRSSIELKECVVSLEKLRITPLKKKGKYLTAAISDDDSVTFNNRGKSQLSFAVSAHLNESETMQHENH